MDSPSLSHLFTTALVDTTLLSVLELSLISWTRRKLTLIALSHSPTSRCHFLQLTSNAPLQSMPSALPDIDDPTDFTSTSLRTLDTALRCQICGELYTAPVLLTTCSHTFDSLCLRNHLKEIKKCPQCQVEANEDRIRRNLVVEEAVSAWRLSRFVTMPSTLFLFLPFRARQREN